MAKGAKTGGRAKGTPNKRSVEGNGKGILPKELLLEYMRSARKMANAAARVVKRLAKKPNLNDKEDDQLRQARKELKYYREEARDCAKDVAQYCHAKLTSNVHSGTLTLEEIVSRSYAKDQPKAEEKTT